MICSHEIFSLNSSFKDYNGKNNQSVDISPIKHEICDSYIIPDTFSDSSRKTISVSLYSKREPERNFLKKICPRKKRNYYLKMLQIETFIISRY